MQDAGRRVARPLGARGRQRGLRVRSVPVEVDETGKSGPNPVKMLQTRPGRRCALVLRGLQALPVRKHDFLGFLQGIPHVILEKRKLRVLGNPAWPRPRLAPRLRPRAPGRVLPALPNVPRARDVPVHVPAARDAAARALARRCAPEWDVVNSVLRSGAFRAFSRSNSPLLRSHAEITCFTLHSNGQVRGGPDGDGEAGSVRRTRKPAVTHPSA